MIQKWYNRILWTSLLILVLGTLFVFPILYQFEIGKMILNTVGLILPISGCVFMVLLFWGGLSKKNYWGHFVNRHNKLVDQSG